uniref:Uncharacterized protein n=1 Tax=Anguilla anguilla TaxID=7936 RepID=A0A0E9QNI6_ANGAN
MWPGLDSLLPGLVILCLGDFCQILTEIRHWISWKALRTGLCLQPPLLIA